jgi:hypothetical protein
MIRPLCMAHPRVQDKRFSVTFGGTFVDAYKQVHELTRSTSLPVMRCDRNCYEQVVVRTTTCPTRGGVRAAIVPTDASSNTINIITRYRGRLLHITKVHPSYVALRFPLLSPTGQPSLGLEMCYTCTASAQRGHDNRDQLYLLRFLKTSGTHPTGRLESDYYFCVGLLFQEWTNEH